MSYQASNAQCNHCPAIIYDKEEIACERCLREFEETICYMGIKIADLEDSLRQVARSHGNTPSASEPARETPQADSKEQPFPGGGQ